MRLEGVRLPHPRRPGCRLSAATVSRDPMPVSDAITQMVEGAMGSPWVFLALFAFAAIDAFLPLVPSESLVITAGVFAASGEPNLAGVIVAAGLGAMAGDHISYFAGRFAGGRFIPAPGSRRAKALMGAGKLLHDRGGVILIICRYIPGARTAVTLTAGAIALSAALLHLLRQHRRLLVGHVLGADRLPRRRGLRGRPAQGPRARARAGARRDGRGRARAPSAPARGDGLAVR